MKYVFALLVVSVVISSAAYAAGGYALYYIDDTHNVSKIAIDASGARVGAPQRITSLGGYDSFSVSPDGKRVFGARASHSQKEEDTGNVWITWQCWIEALGSRTKRQLLETRSLMEEPWVAWSPASNAFTVCDGAFDVDLTLYRCAGRAVTAATHGGSIPAFSSDCRFVACTCVPADKGSDSWGLYLLDLASGKSTALGDGGSVGAWVGKTHTFAWRGALDDVIVADVTPRASAGPLLKNQRQLAGGYCRDIRYIPGKGLYMEYGQDENARADYSSDLKTITSGPVLDHKASADDAYDRAKPYAGAWLQYACSSADGRLVACPVDRGANAMPAIRVFDPAGNSTAVACGKSPQWRGTDIWGVDR